MKIITSLIFAVICVIIAPAQNALSENSRRLPSVDGIFSAGPYYNRSSMSYFELRRSNNITWEQASHAAENHIFKNTPGRLATIATTKTHSFLLTKFSFEEDTWLGLQFFCENSELKWTDGSSPISNNFSNWDTSIEKQNYNCAHKKYVSGYIKNHGVNWQIGNSDKRSNFYLVEYPTVKK